MGTIQVMTSEPLQVGDNVVIEREHLEHLLRALVDRGCEVIGPTIREGAIVYDHLASTEDLPEGWTDEQAGGKYQPESPAGLTVLASPRPQASAVTMASSPGSSVT